MPPSRGSERSLSRPVSRSQLLASISDSVRRRPSQGMLVAQAAAAELNEMDDSYTHLVEHHARLARDRLKWGQQEAAVTYLRQGVEAVEGASKGAKGNWRGKVAVAKARLALAAVMSEAGDHHAALRHGIDAMDEVEGIYERCGEDTWKPGRALVVEGCGKVLCVARHLLATELEFLNAPPGAVAELVDAARELETDLSDSFERRISSAQGERFSTRQSVGPEKPSTAEAPRRKRAPEGSLLYRACVRAREALAEDAVARARKDSVQSQEEEAEVGLRVRKSKPPVKKGFTRMHKSALQADLKSPEERKARNIFKEFLSTSGAENQRRAALVEDARKFQRHFTDCSSELKKDLEYKSVSDLHDMKIFHSSFAWPRHKRRLRRQGLWVPQPLHPEVSGLKQDLRGSVASMPDLADLLEVDDWIF